jgi:hypothetical protein
MKKQTLRNLSLNKKTVSNLEVLTQLKGGATDWPDTAKYCPIPPAPEPTPIPATWFPLCHSKYNPCPLW